jgi:hypothetical protein
MAIFSRRKFYANAVALANTLVGTQTTAGTLYGVNSKLHVITVNNSIAIRANLVTDSGMLGGVIESIVEEINPLAYFTTGSTVTNQANIFIVTDKHIDSTDLQHRIRQIGANTSATRLTATTFTYANTSIISAGGNSIDISGTQVVEGTSFTVL